MFGLCFFILFSVKTFAVHASASFNTCVSDFVDCPELFFLLFVWLKSLLLLSISHCELLDVFHTFLDLHFTDYQGLFV